MTVQAKREPTDFAHSLTDLMAGVAAIFLLLAVVFILLAAKREQRERTEKQESQKRIDALEQFRQSVIDSLLTLRQDIGADKSLSELITVDDEARRRDPFLFVIVFNRQRLSFPAGVCTLGVPQEEIVSQAAPRVLAHVCRFARRMEESRAAGGRATIAMTLEGHTDRHPFLPNKVGCGVDKLLCRDNDSSEDCQRIGFENNVRLSAARAQNVFFSIRRSLQGNEEISSCLDRYFVVAGRGPVEPADGRASWREASTTGDEEHDRRVILKIRAQPALSSSSEDAAGAAQ